MHFHLVQMVSKLFKWILTWNFLVILLILIFMMGNIMILGVETRDKNAKQVEKPSFTRKNKKVT